MPIQIHPLTMEDILSVGQRPQLDDTESYLFLSLKMLQFDEKKKKTLNEQVSFVLNQRFANYFSRKNRRYF